MQEVDGGNDQRIEELLDTDGQHQHGEGDSDQRVEDGEDLSSGRQRSCVSITWERREETQAKTKRLLKR